MSSHFRLPSTPSPTDPGPLFELFRGSYTTELLACGLVEFRIFEFLAGGSKSMADLAGFTSLQPRPLQVLVTGLRAMGTLEQSADGRIGLTPVARLHLVESADYYVGGYFRRSAESPGARELAERLRTNQPRGSRPDEPGVGYLFREGLKSAMEEEDSARALTLQLAGRAANVAPVLAERLPLAGARHLVDVGGGSGIYSMAFLRRNPELRATVWDRPEVLKVAEDFARESGVGDRLSLQPGDMFADPVPGGADVLLLSNVLHDWDVPECRRIVERCARALAPGGRLLVHDVFLDRDLGGPLPAALYSTHLFSVTEGRLYSGEEVTEWLAAAGLRPVQTLPTLIHCSVMISVRV